MPRLLRAKAADEPAIASILQLKRNKLNVQYILFTVQELTCVQLYIINLEVKLTKDPAGECLWSMDKNSVT